MADETNNSDDTADTTAAVVPIDHGVHGRIDQVDLQLEMQRSYLDYASVAHFPRCATA
jgi:DNA gyrase subunit A